MTSFFTTNVLSNHQVGLVICRALHALGTQPEETLRKLLIPPSNDFNEGTTQWEDTAVGLKRTGVVHETDGRWELTQELSISEDVNAWNFALVFLKGLTTVNSEGLLRDEDPDDLFKALLWFSDLPIGYTYAMFDDAGHNPNLPAQRLKTFGFADALERVDQWRAFHRWLRGLGLIRQLDRDLHSVDISGFVHSYISNCDIDGSLDQFVMNLSQNLPMFYSTDVSHWYEKSTGLKREFSKINHLLGWALFTAEEKNLISFYTEDDAKVPTLAVPGGEGNSRLFTHIKKVA